MDSTTSPSAPLDDVFKFLQVATDLEEKDPIEAATKYYEAVYLMRRYIEKIPIVDEDGDHNNSNNSHRKIKDLLLEKASHYDRVASALVMGNDDDERDDNTIATAVSKLTISPRSPFTSSAAGDSVNSSTNQTDRGKTNRLFFPDDSATYCQSRNGSQYNRNNNSNNTSRGQQQQLSSSTSHEIDSLASRANAKLAQALDLDEKGSSSSSSSASNNSNNNEATISMYMEAAELYLQAIQLCQKQKQPQRTSVMDSLKRRLEQTLDRVEVLKHPNKKRHMHTEGKAQRNIGLQQNKDCRSSLTKDEVRILKESSMIASGLFLPWSNDDARKLAVDCQGSSSMIKTSSSAAPLFTDPDGFLRLSSKQQQKFHRWARPHEILRLRQQHAVLSSILKPIQGKPTMVKSITPYTIQQKYVTDCSFIASLCICATYERRFQKRLVTSVLHPQDAKTGQLLYNPTGKYMVRLWLNGVARCVVIDDYLPIDKYGNLLCSQTTNNSSSSLELWVCLIEKAYMKLCGGYDFPGSNSGVDLFSLTGWIPERIHFAKDPNNVRDFETPPDRAWERIFGANSYGDCLITVSTQVELPEAEADAVGLVTGHAYAVLAVIETRNGTRLLQLKNPWAHRGWKGRFSCRDREGWGSHAFRQEVGYDPELASKQDDGVFWICWEDMLKYFKNCHLSWNPALFQSRLTVHGCWPRDQGPKDDTFNIGENPQYTLSLSDKAITKKATLWILISRHVSKQEQEGCEVCEVNDYLTVHIHRNTAKRERIWYPGQSGNCVLTGCYTNNPHVLVRYDVQDASDKHLSIILSQYKKSNNLNYTLSCYCTEYFQLGRPEKDLEHHKELSSAWSTYTAGGPIGQAHFVKNPQFSLHVPAKTTLQVQVSTLTTVAANAIVVPVRQYGNSIEKATAEPVIDSGKYRHNFVATEKRIVKAGDYALIVSNYHVGHTGIFTVKVSSGFPKVRFEKIDTKS